jgi:iron complex outermembrane receptor protein
MSCSLYPSEKRKLTAQILYSDLFYQLPGGLTKKQYNENPRQARPGVVEKNSSIDHKNFLAGLVQHYKWNEKIRNITSVYFSDGVKENPFVTNYELEKLKSLGSRTTFNISLQLGNLPMVFNVGAEINYGIFHATNHDNIDGYAGPLRYEDELKSLQTFVFFQAGLSLSEKWNLNLSASLNYLEYDIHRIRDVAQDTSYHINRIFNPEFIPRCGVVGKLNRELSLYGSVSAGFSPPTTEEIRTSDGGINDDLEAERAISFEVGIRGNNKSERLYYDASVFRMQQKETIVSKTTEEGTVVFENAGSTSQPGLELLLGYVFVKEPSSVISLLKLQASYTYHNFSFSNYEKRRGDENIDYSGNNLTGTALNIFVYTLDIESKGGGYLNFTYNYTDKIPLNDANTVFADSYQLITAKAGWKAKFRQKYLLEIFIGIDNLLNEKYSLGNDLNAFGERYYNAAPERNYYGGVKFLF